MDGVHDMGGMDGFGKVEPEANEPVFHNELEGRVLAMNRIIGTLGIWNIDVGRYGIEVLPPHVYLSSSYYKKWFLRLEKLLVEKGFVDADEVAAGRKLHQAKPLASAPFTQAQVEQVTKRGDYGRAPSAPALFKPGDRVRAKNIHPKSHTRLPRYVRGHAGVVERLHGAHVFPDAAVAKGIEEPQWLYTVCFDGRDLWGPESDPALTVSIDAFEPYLEPA
jgi:nitrile hydratase